MKVLRWCVVGLATAGYLSYLPHWVMRRAERSGAGLIGSLAGLLLVWVSPVSGAAFWWITALVVAGSVLVSHWAEAWMGQKDDPRIVIDEVAGMWVACLGLPHQWKPLALAFVLFRVFDIWKGPWGNRLQRFRGGCGVVLDDLLAGLIANGLARAALAVFPSLH